MERLICVRQLNEDVSLGHLRDPTEPAPSILIVFTSKGHNPDDSTSEVTRCPAIGIGTARSRRTERAETHSGDGRENRTNRDREPRQRTRRRKHTLPHAHTPRVARREVSTVATGAEVCNHGRAHHPLRPSGWVGGDAVWPASNKLRYIASASSWRCRESP